MKNEIRIVADHFSEDVFALLMNGTPVEIHEQTLACLDAPAPRFVGVIANAILHGTPPENLYALYDTIKNYKGSS
jgi:hypothetical protein